MRAGARVRIGAIVLKDVAELARNPGAVLPALAVLVAALIPSYLVAVAAPRLSGERLDESSEFAEAARTAIGVLPELAALDAPARIQAFLFHQFGLLLLLVPVVGAMAIAAHAVVGEKIGRSLEPLLATPISTAELLAAKTLTPLGFALFMMWLALAIFVAGIAVIGEPGVWRTFASGRSAVLFFVLGPLLSLVSLLLTVIISSRVNDPRSAQQLGGLVVLPITGVFLAQIIGQYVLGIGALALAALALGALAVVLLWVGVRVFQRERILMRWR
jgi:ABC-2 type transport system permease protein